MLTLSNAESGKKRSVLTSIITFNLLLMEGQANDGLNWYGKQIEISDPGKKKTLRNSKV